jgi:predicted enzyme related to lactoylglutathione lyase
MDAVGRLGWIQIDCMDPMRQATFWGAILGQECDEPLGDPVHYLGLVPTVPGAPVVSFQRVPEAKAVKNRLHFDIPVDDVDAAAARVVELGGSIVPHEDLHEYGFSWRLAADPEGNEFCLIY